MVMEWKETMHSSMMQDHGTERVMVLGPSPSHHTDTGSINTNPHCIAVSKIPIALKARENILDFVNDNLEKRSFNWFNPKDCLNRNWMYFDCSSVCSADASMIVLCPMLVVAENNTFEDRAGKKVEPKKSSLTEDSTISFEPDRESVIEALDACLRLFALRNLGMIIVSNSQYL